MMTDGKDILNLIRHTKQVVLVTHIKPDGDALGSLFGLADVLQAMDKKVFCLLEEEVPQLYRFLPGRQQVETSFAAADGFIRAADGDVLTIALDCGDVKRLGKYGSQFRARHPFMVIDHHRGNNGFGDVNWIEP
ncbi:MAG TPA: bifunctional oligoribonuclease/PAP phosphatase NrnA, partial [Desulfobulbaceae bacterium]|nr:bifunctional oligoribonuclease/PAP phosphatase NrnA [Desulfobulbaceae bacterium]